jgi:hypothetical protein
VAIRSGKPVPEDSRQDSIKLTGGGAEGDATSRDGARSGPAHTREALLVRRNRQLVALLLFAVAAAVAAAAFFLGQYSKAGAIEQRDHQVAGLQQRLTTSEARLTSETVLAEALETKVASEGDRADRAEGNLASTQAKNTNLSTNLDHSRSLVSLYKQMGDVDSEMTDSLNRAIEDIDIAWGACTSQDWARGYQYAGKADDAVAEAKRLRKRREAILAKIEAASD